MFRLSTKCIRSLSLVSKSLPTYGKGSIFEIIKGKKYMKIVTTALWAGPGYDGLGLAKPNPEFCTEYIMHELNELVVYRMVLACNKSFINTSDEIFVVTKELFDKKMKSDQLPIITKDKMISDILSDGESDSYENPLADKILIS